MERLTLRVALGLMAGMIFTTAAYGQTAEAPRLATVLRYAVILEGPRAAPRWERWRPAPR